MKVKDMRNLIKDLDDEVDIEVNSVWNEEKQELTPSSCEAFYHEKDNKVYITPEVIAMSNSILMNPKCVIIHSDIFSK